MLKRGHRHIKDTGYICMDEFSVFIGGEIMKTHIVFMQTHNIRHVKLVCADVIVDSDVDADADAYGSSSKMK